MGGDAVFLCRGDQGCDGEQESGDEEAFAGVGDGGDETAGVEEEASQKEGGDEGEEDDVEDVDC